jgi:hypothetical protein
VDAAFSAGIGAGGELDVLGNVDDDRTRPAGGGDIEGFVHGARQIVDIA